MASRKIVTCCCSSPSPATSLSTARTFLHLGHDKHLRNTPPTVLDFLAPRMTHLPVKQRWSSHSRFPEQRLSIRRTFTTSTKRAQTIAIHNPKLDDEGAAMNVEITPRASNRLKEIMSKDSNPNLALRIQVESGGCHGFQYLMSLTTLPSQDSSPGSIQEEMPPALNTSSMDPNVMLPRTPTPSAVPSVGSGTKEVEGSLGEDDVIFAADNGSGAKVVMDGPSLDLLKGSKIDYTMELIGSQFKIVDNPLATSSCGCGTSFDIKF